MPTFIHSLESRTFFSATFVTAATLLADKAGLLADVANGTSAFKALVADVTSGTKAIALDLKTLPKTNAAPLKTLKSDEAKAKAMLTTDLNLLEKSGGSLAKKALSTGESLLTKATVKTLVVAATEITALGTVTTAPLAHLQTALFSTPVSPDLQGLATANPGATALANDVSTALGNISTQTAALGTAATQFATDIANLKSDLSSIATAVGTFPNIVGTLDGTNHVTKGADTGGNGRNNIVITSEDAAGNLVGSLIDVTHDQTYALKATISLNGKFVGVAVGPYKPSTIDLLGQFTSGTLTGTFKLTGQSGTFTVTEIP
jgi:hypothetical protein